MGAKTGISWTDSTWNPIRGCSMAPGSETKGCLNCYAARLNSRGLPGLLSPTTGKPLARILESGPRWTGEVVVVEKNLMLPLKWKQPKRIFVNSMSDLFHDALSDQQIDRVFAVMGMCDRHTFQVLTKRPERMLAYVSDPETPGRIEDQVERMACEYQAIANWPFTNVWLGVSVEDQATADARIPLLLQTPAAKRFVSHEPALGAVDYESIRSTQGLGETVLNPECWGDCRCDEAWGKDPGCRRNGGDGRLTRRIDQIIIGGESGPKARPFDVQWAYETVIAGWATDTAVFVKQMGSVPVFCAEHDPSVWPVPVIEHELGWSPVLQARSGADPSEWPKDLRVQEFPQ